MPQIELLDQQTIDKIAAGEVVDRPSSVVKELVENAIDAQSTAITVEIKDGGTSLIRITDNGCGIEEGQIIKAFYRHSTSKIREVDDLLTIHSLGFRGEALSSISAVSQMELITKPVSQLIGCRYTMEGGKGGKIEEIGVPNGTTMIVRNLFYNTPARKKFLRAPQTEAGYISALMERIALSHPDISFKFINNGQMKLHTSGNGSVKDIIYHIYGREITANLIPVEADFPEFSVSGFIGKPLISRGNRNLENYFINGRYITSKLINKAIEDGYKGYMMQHQYPFTVLHLTIDGSLIDVNVHPSKMEIRFSHPQPVYEQLKDLIHRSLQEKELIPDVSNDKKTGPDAIPKDLHAPEPFEQRRIAGERGSAAGAPDLLQRARESVRRDSPYETRYPDRRQDPQFLAEAREAFRQEGAKDSPVSQAPQDLVQKPEAAAEAPAGSGKKEPQPVQQSFEKLLSAEARPNYKIIGQLFDTYWLIEFGTQFYMIDQHAAHEKVLFEKTMKAYREKKFYSQIVSPPVVLNLSMTEENLLQQHMESFEKLGFSIEPFGDQAYAIREIPADLYSLNAVELFRSLIDDLSLLPDKDAPDMVLEKVASMSCKAAVKGASRLSRAEIEQLIDDLLELENPYFCPHGRPVIVSMTKYEIDKKFKRII